MLYRIHFVVVVVIRSHDLSMFSMHRLIGLLIVFKHVNV